VLSLSAPKVATSGEGGLAVFRDRGPAERFLRLRNYGMDESGDVAAPGLNGRMSELHAALGVLTLPRMAELAAARADRVDRYRTRLAEFDLAFQEVPHGARPGYTALAIDFGQHRARVEERLNRAGIEARRYFRPLHPMPAYADFRTESLPMTERLGRGVLCLPLYADLPLTAVDRVSAEVEASLAQAGVSA
jgi:dTDP-4-amino-4,6-dideoxygalactose transaminase